MATVSQHAAKPANSDVVPTVRVSRSGAARMANAVSPVISSEDFEFRHQDIQTRSRDGCCRNGSRHLLCKRLTRAVSFSSRSAAFRFAASVAAFSSGLVVLARGKHPIPSRTRPLRPAAPMVLWPKPWESRSSPNLTKTLQDYALSHNPNQNAPSSKEPGAFCVCGVGLLGW